MIRAGSLTYAVFVSVITAILCTMMILLAFMNRSFFIRTDRHEKVRDNAESGIAVAMALQTSEDYDQWHDLFQEGSDSVRVKRRKWGVYEVIAAMAVKADAVYRKTAIAGYHSEDLGKTALWLADRNRPLQVSGNALLKGECSLPEKGVDRAYVEGTNYSREKLVYGNTRNSKPEVPSVSGKLTEYWQAYLGQRYNAGDSIIDFASAGNLIDHSFLSRTLVMHSKEAVSLSGYSYTGNIIISSAIQINVSKTADLDQVILVAPKIKVEEGVTAALHLIASDSIIIHEKVRLAYPSSLIMINRSGKSPYLRIAEGADIRGSIVSYAENVKRSNDLAVEILPEAIVKGAIYCQGNFELSGKVQGTVICNNFLLATPSGIYENHLLHGEIDRTLLNKDFSAFPVEGWNNHMKLITWRSGL